MNCHCPHLHFAVFFLLCSAPILLYSHLLFVLRKNFTRFFNCDVLVLLVNVLGGSLHTLKENAEALVAATREIGLEVSADKTKYMVMSRD